MIPKPPRAEEDASKLWFASEVSPHEPSLRRYLRQRFPTFRDTDDLVQETYVRVWRARWNGYTFDSKRYMYSTARNAALDFFRHEQVLHVRRLPQIDALPISDGCPDPAESACRSDELAILEEAIHALPRRCREVLICRKLFGLSQKEIAAKLGISENTVSTQVSNGMKRCIGFFRDRRQSGGDKRAPVRTGHAA